MEIYINITNYKLSINYVYFKMQEIDFVTYSLCTGYQRAREAVAEYSSNEFVKVDPKVRSTRAFIEYR